MSSSRATFALAAALAWALVAACALGCSASQDLGYDDPRASSGGGTGDRSRSFGDDWVDPSSPTARDQACPVSRPIEGDACSPRASAPCSYAPLTPDDAAAICICTRQQRWDCLQGVVMRDLSLPIASGALCMDGVEITRDCTPGESIARGTHCEARCRCVSSRIVCEVL